MPTALRVVVGEDHLLVQEGIVRVLEKCGFDVVAVAGDATALTAHAAALQPDVVVTDIRMPPQCEEDGLRAAVQIRASRPEIGVVVLSQYLDGRYALDLIGDRPEGVGYLLKENIAAPGALCDAVRRVAEGGSAFDPDVIAHIVARRRVNDPLDQLTPREREVLALMAQGHSNTGIAESLVVTVPAIERHITNIFTKLGLHEAPSSRHRRVLAVLRHLQR